jgi:hypothetical protein
MYLKNTTGMLRPKIMRMFLCDVLSTESEYATNLEVKGG